MGQELLIRVRKLVSSDISTCWVGVFSGGLIGKECFSNYEIRNRLLLGGVCFDISLMFRLYTVHLFCSFLQIFIHLVQRPNYINNIFTIKKKL
jgi:hypothetical protein